MRLPVILSAVAALGLMEAVAYWWMHPEPTGYGDPVLAYRPQAGRDPALPAHSLPSTVKNPLSEFSSSSPNRSSYTLLPEIVSQSIPALHCSTGTAARIDRDDGITVHVAFFQWDFAAFNNVYEAFSHMPEQCMGAIGMTLVKVHPPRSYVLSGQGAANATAQSTSPTHHSISFAHTEFRHPNGWPIHAFKGVWFSGSSDFLRDGFRGSAQQWREFRWKAALKRFLPAYTRVAQGAVHRIADPDRAWEIFEQSMLRDLTFERQSPVE